MLPSSISHTTLQQSQHASLPFIQEPDSITASLQHSVCQSHFAAKKKLLHAMDSRHSLSVVYSVLDVTDGQTD